MSNDWDFDEEDDSFDSKPIVDIPEFFNIKYDFDTREFNIPVSDLSTVFQYCLGNVNRKDSRLEAIQNFLGSEDFDSHHRDFIEHEIAANIKCFHTVVQRDFDILNITNFNDTVHGSDKEVAPKYREFDVGPNLKESLMCEGYIFARHKQFSNLVVFEVAAFLDGGSGYLEFRTHYLRDDKIVHSFWDAVKTYFCMEGPLKGNAINNKWEYIIPTSSELSDVILNETAKLRLNRNILSFLQKSDLLAAKGLSKSRGILFHGPPGTGKTMTCEAIINQVDCTVICVSNDTVESLREIKRIYSLAEKLAPTLMIIEDIDTLGGLDRREGSSHPLLGELLTSLNGNPSGNVVTIATTNYPAYLDRALADRPGRFDIRIEFPIPSLELRKDILSKYLKKFTTKKIDLQTLAKQSKGLTGAYLREVVTTAYLITMEKNKKFITQDTLSEALKQVQEMKHIALSEIGTNPVSSEEMFS